MDRRFPVALRKVTDFPQFPLSYPGATQTKEQSSTPIMHFKGLFSEGL